MAIGRRQPAHDKRPVRSFDYDERRAQTLIIKSEDLIYDSNNLVDFIEEGGFCYVYRALYGGRYVALKKLKEDVKRVPKQYEDCMRREARCLKNLLHPNIVEFQGMVWEPNFHAIVLEYIANRDLRSFAHKYAPLHPFVKAKLIGDIAKGMNYLHTLPKQVIHNDLKAGNVLVSDSLVAKITDFGLAEWISFTTKFHTNSPQSRVKGATVTHRSPESWRNINHVSTTNDIYSFSILLWEIFSEKVPFGNASNEDIRMAVIEGQRPDENLLPSNTPSEMIDMMKRCWQQDPSKRPDFSSIVKDMSALLCRAEYDSTIKTIVPKLVELSLMDQCTTEDCDLTQLTLDKQLSVSHSSSQVTLGSQTMPINQTSFSDYNRSVSRNSERSVIASFMTNGIDNHNNDTVSIL